MAERIEYLCNPQRFPQPDDILCYRQFMVEERLLLPCHKPNINQLVDAKVKPVIEEYKFIDSPQGKKVYIRGKLEQEILYTEDSDCQPVHLLQVDYQFRSYMNLCKCTPNWAVLQSHTPSIIVEFMETSKTCSRSIGKTIILFVWYPRNLVITPHPKPIHVINQPTEAVPLKPAYEVINLPRNPCGEELCRHKPKERNRKRKVSHKYDFSE